MATKIKGIDISTWQGTPDFSKVKAAGVQFVIARAGYGQNNIDKQFRRNASECNRLGIPFGVYWFSYALNAEMARQEARYCLEAVKGYRLEYPIFSISNMIPSAMPSRTASPSRRPSPRRW